MKFNPEKPFVTRIGDTETGIRFIQDGVAYDGAKKPMGKMVKGKLQKSDKPGPEVVKEGEIKANGLVDDSVGGDNADEVVDEAVALDDMDLDQLKAVADELGVAYKSNIGAETLRGKIEAAQ